MIKKLFPNLSERGKTGSWSLSQKTSLSAIFFYLLVLFLPTQLGKHFWPNFSYVYGIRTDYLSPTLYFTDILIILIIFFWVFEKHKDIRKIFSKLRLLLIFLLFLLVGIIQSSSQIAGGYGLVKVLEYIFLFSYTAKNFRNLNGAVLFSTFIAGILLESSLTIAQYINQGSLGGILYFLGERSFNSQTPGIANTSINGQLFLRPYATFSHPNVLAGYLLIFMTFIVFYSRQKFFKRQNIVVYFSLTLGSLALFLTMSRVSIFAWVLFLICLFAYSFWKKTRMVPTKKAYLQPIKNRVLFLTLFILITFIFTYPVGLRFFQFSFSDQSVVQREVLIKDSVIMFKKNPLFGVGLNNFLINLPFVQKQHGEVLYIQPVHNIYLLVLSQAGIIGFVLFLYFLMKTYRIVEKITNFELPMLFLLILFLGLFDHYFLTLQQGQLMLTVLLGLFWGFSKKIS